MLRRVNKATARKLFNQGTKPIWLCPCKMPPDGPFSMAAIIFGQEYLAQAERYREHPDLWKGTLEKTAWQLMVNNWTFYNASHEAGYYPHYYVDD